MSMPTTCTAQLDYIGQVLYGAHVPTLDRTIRDSGKRMAAMYSTAVPWHIAEKATTPTTPRNKKIAAFFLLLNADVDLKNVLVDFCPHRAGRFYQELDSTIMPQWLKDETHTLDTLVERLKDAYRNC